MPRQSSGADSPTSTSSRRAFLAAAGAAGLLGLGGCVQGTGDGDGDDGGDGSDGSDGDGDDGGGGTTTGTTTSADLGTATFGVLSPTSGPFSPLGSGQRQGAEQAVEFVNGSDEFDFEIDAVYEDTQTDPAAGRQAVQRVVEQDGANFVAGGINSSVALAIMDYVGNNQRVYTSGGAALAITGEQCNPFTFRNETNTAQQAAGMVGYALSELGDRVWIHTADYAYGNSAIEEIRNRMDDPDGTIVGTTKPELGTQNFGPQITQISNSEADVLMIPLTGGDLINFINQADSEGLTDEVEIIGTAIFAQLIRGAVGASADGLYSSVLYNHKLEVGDNAQFVQAYRDAYDAGPPGSFARVGYEAVRMQARGIQAAGSTDPADVRDAMEGLEVTTVLGDTSFRACDHQSVNPVWTGRMNLPDGGEVTEVELLQRIDGEEATPACSEVGCEF
jgi:branched-chain amino acid transport system substrate-binding protein